MMVSVLYVDDEPSLLDITKLYLERKAALSVDTAVSAENAQEKRKSKRYDVIVSDYQMPGMDGIQFLKALRSSGDETPFILFTGKGREEVAIEALNNGADFYLQKGGDPKTQFTELVHMIRRASQSRQAQEDLKKSEEKYRELVQHANSIILRMDPVGTITFLNDYAEQFFGFREDEVLGKNVVGTIVPPLDSKGKDLAAMIRDIAHNPAKYFYNENENVKRNGERVWIAWTNKPLLDEQGSVTGVLCIGSDITDRKRAEEALRNSEQRLADIIQFLPDATFAIDVAGKVITWNRAIEQMTGIPAEAIVGKGGYEYAIPFYGERRPILLDLVLQYDRSAAGRYGTILREGEKLVSETFIPRLNGGKGAHLWFTASPLYDSDGRIIGAIETIRNITRMKQAETALKESEDRYRTLAEAVPDIVLRIDRSGRILWTNAAGSAFFGDDVTGRSVTDYISEGDFGDAFLETIDIRDASVRIATITTMVRRRDGSMRFLAWNCKPLPSVSGNPGAIAAARDVTDERRAQEVLGTTTALLEGVLDGISDVIGVQLPDHTILRYNRAGYELTGMTPEQAAGKKCYELIGRITPCDVCATRNALAIGTIETVEKYVPEISRYMICRSNPILDEAGNVIMVIEQLTDVTERWNVEKALEESEARYRAFVESSDDLVFLKDPGGRYVMANPPLLRFFGKSEAEVIGRTDVDLMPRSAAESCSASDRAALADGRVVVSEEIVGDQVFETRKFPVRLPNGETFVGGFIKDVTIQRSQERAIRESEENYRLVVENAHEGILVVQDYRIVYANQSLCEITGYSASEMPNVSIEERLHPDDREPVLANHQWRIASGRPVPPYSFRIMRKDGGIRWLCMEGGVPLRWDGSEAVLLFVSDITDRKRAEDALRESEEKFRAVFHNANEAIVLIGWSPDGMPGKILDINDIACRRLGYGRSDSLSLNCSDLGINQYLLECRTLLDELRAGSMITFEFTIRDKGDRGIPLEIYARTFDLFGQSIIIATARDVTERHMMEQIEKKAFEQLERNIEQFAILGDHIRNPLGAIMGLADLCGTAAAEKIIDQARAIDRLVTELDRGWIESEKVREFVRKRYG